MSAGSGRIFYALTGLPGSGKTTAILRIVNRLMELGIKVGGMYTQEIRDRGRRIGFAVKSISGGEGILAHINLKNGPRLGKYVVNLNDLESVGVAAILEAIEGADVVVVDEVGPMELYSEKFRHAVEELLTSSKHAIITVHYKSRDPLILKVKELAGKRLITLTPENRDIVPDTVVGEVLEVLGRK
ncbi:MAG: NTPase [Thaumarchaeota archaeon]|jgi:nucleoside-triphosphatase|nr:NTPase [Candidatus Wolframiiraptor allenii]